MERKSEHLSEQSGAQKHQRKGGGTCKERLLCFSELAVGVDDANELLE